MEDLKDIIAKNLIKFRKSAKLTQLELAEKLKYSDKNVSKWERGESVPDVVILKQLADLYGLKVDDFFSENIQPVNNIEQNTVKCKTRMMDKKQMLILLLSISLVWLTAIVLFSVCLNVQMFADKAWLCFIYAITASCIIAVIFTSIWCTNLLNAITVSMLIWSSALSVFLSIPSPAIWAIFLVCVPLQLLDILWFTFRKVNKNFKEESYLEERRKRKQEKQKIKDAKKQEKMRLREERKQKKLESKLEEKK